ncbi:MAG: serine hydrolase domain-containing protein [Acidobacteriota bacterium]
MFKNSRVTLLFVLPILCSCSSIDAVVPEVEYRGPEHTRAYLEAFVEAPGGPPSISLAVAVGGEIVVAEAVGWADIAAQVAATPETAYRTYSVSKGITAVAVMQAVEADLLDLDADIRQFVPAFPEKPWPVRLRHLLTHTSGIRHYKKNAGEISSTVEYPSLAASLVVFGDDPLEFEPGTAYRYTSFGFNLLTGALEAVHGAGFDEILQRDVFGPAAMSRSSLALVGRSGDGLAKAYWPPRAGSHREIDELPNVSGKYGSSGVVATPSDLVRLFLALEEGRLLRPANRERMLTVADPTVAASQALGWNLVEEKGRRVVYRSGAGTGYTGLVEYFPDLGIAGAVLINQNQYPGRVEILEGALDYFAERATSVDP